MIDQTGIGDRCELHQGNFESTVGELAADLQSQPGFANAAGSDERDQSGLLKVAAHLGNVALAANQTARGEG